MTTLTVTSVTKDSPGAGQVTIVGTYADIAPTAPAQQTSVGESIPSNPKWARAWRASDYAVFCVRAGSNSVAMVLSGLAKVAVALENSLTFPPYVSASPANATCAGTAAAHQTLTWDNTSGPGDGETVTIGTKVYTFKTALTPAEGEVLLNGGGDAALLNLIRAINHSGTPGTDYSCAAANAQVTAAASVTSHAFAVTAITSGLAGNAIATTETSAHLSWGSTTLTGGTDAAANFAVTVGSELAVTYQWQYSSDGGTTWANCTGTINGTAYTNGTTATLTCAPTTTGQTGLLHRCTATNSLGATNSNPAVLTIS